MPERPPCCNFGDATILHAHRLEDGCDLDYGLHSVLCAVWVFKQLMGNQYSYNSVNTHPC